VSLLDNDSMRKWLAARILCEVETKARAVALTFDDGPNPNHTPRLLRILERARARATFFVVGKRVRRFETIVSEVTAAGHEIGNHSLHHLPMTAMPGRMVQHEIESTSRLIADATGRHPRFFRPPMGWFHRGVLARARAAGCVSVIGSIHPQDSRRPPAAAIEHRVMRRVAPGAIVILHDGGWRIGCDRSHTIAAAENLVTRLQDEGYALVTLSDLVAGAKESSRG